MIDEQFLTDLAERLRHRYYGKYRGVVTQVDGPNLRVKAKVPAVLAEQESGWAMPCVPYAGPQVGVAFLPEVGSGVWIEFEGGDVSFPIWTGCYWRAGEPPAEAKPDAKAIVSKSVTIVLDDGQSRSSWGDANKNAVSLEAGGIVVEREGKKVKVEPARVVVNDGALEVV